MGKKEKWFSAIKKVFVHSSKEKQVNEFAIKTPKESRKQARGQKHGETKSFIPMFREPSSIEEILGEIDEQKLLIRPLTSFEPPKTPPSLTPKASSPKATNIRIASPKASSQRVASPHSLTPRDASPKATYVLIASPKASLQRVASPRTLTPRDASPKATYVRIASPKASSQRATSPKAAASLRNVNSHRPEPTLRYKHLSATKIQSAYRGYMARRSVRALRGLVRLQGVVRGQNVERQTCNAMKMMQHLVRIQTQIQSRRIHMLQKQAYKFDNELESTLGKWVTNQSQGGNLEDWDDSTLTKEEREERMQKKMEAVFKRERAMAYAHSHQTGKSNPKAPQVSVLDLPPDGFPWWRNWTQRQLPDPTHTQPTTPLNNLTPPRRTPGQKLTARPVSYHKSPHNTTFDYYGSTTPTSTRSMAPTRSKHFMPTPTHKSDIIKKKQGQASSVYEMGLKDDDSLTSCPPFSVPNYMSPTVSATAKVRASSNPKERFPGMPGNDSKKRFSFPLTPNIGPFKWNKGSSKKDSGPKNMQTFDFPGNFSVDSSISVSSTVGRKPFNRFV